MAGCAPGSSLLQDDRCCNLRKITIVTRTKNKNKKNLKTAKISFCWRNRSRTCQLCNSSSVTRTCRRIYHCSENRLAACSPFIKQCTLEIKKETVSLFLCLLVCGFFYADLTIQVISQRRRIYESCKLKRNNKRADIFTKHQILRYRNINQMQYLCHIRLVLKHIDKCDYFFIFI